jgi:hypothetical protein
VRVIDDLIQALKPVIVDVLATPPANAPSLPLETALNLVTSTANKVIGNSPSLVLFDGQYQASRVVILDGTTAQVVTPGGGVMNVQAKNGDTAYAVSGSGRVQMVQSNMVVTQGSGLASNTEFAVYLFSEPTLLGVGKTNDRGEFFVSFEVENEIPLGNHTLQVNGLLSDGRTSSVSVPVTVLDQAAAAESNEAPIDQALAAEISAVSFEWLAFLALFVFVLGFWWVLGSIWRRKRYRAYNA